MLQIPRPLGRALFNDSISIILSDLQKRAPRDPIDPIHNAISGCSGCCGNSGGSIALDLENKIQEIIQELRACCQAIQLDFQGTWSIIQTGFNGTFSALDSIVSVTCQLGQIFNQIESCCKQTFTAIAAINCQQELSGVFTALFDLKNSVTLCCFDLQTDI